MGFWQWLKDLFSDNTHNNAPKPPQTGHFNWDKLDPVDAYEWRDQYSYHKNRNRKK